MPEIDQIQTDPDDELDVPEEPAVNRTPTRPLPSVHKTRIEVDLDDPEAVAGVLELIAKIVREKRRLVLIVE